MYITRIAYLTCQNNTLLGPLMCKKKLKLHEQIFKLQWSWFQALIFMFLLKYLFIIKINNVLIRLIIEIND